MYFLKSPSSTGINVALFDINIYYIFMINDFEIERMYSDTITDVQFDNLQVFVNEQKKLSDHPAIKNMDESDTGLLGNIKSKTRWHSDIGEISILKYHNKIIGVSAVEFSELHTNLSIGGIRCWLSPNFRNNQLVTNYLLNSNLDWSKSKNMWAMMLTFNDYNKTIYDGIKRKSLGKSIAIGTIWSDWWDDLFVIDYPIIIRYTIQWCVLKPITYKAYEIFDRLNNE